MIIILITTKFDEHLFYSFHRNDNENDDDVNKKNVMMITSMV